MICDGCKWCKARGCNEHEDRTGRYVPPPRLPMTDSIRVPLGDEWRHAKRFADGEEDICVTCRGAWPCDAERAVVKLGMVQLALDTATARALAAEEAVRDGAIPAMRFAAARLSTLGDDSTATDLRADADKIAANLNRTASGDEG